MHLNNQLIFLIVVYAKCTKDLRRELWNDLRKMVNNIQGIWGSMRNFNVITFTDDKKG